MSDFFDKPEPEEVPEAPVEQTPVQPEKIKVGEEEYTQDELRDLVGLGKIGREAEEKFNTKIDRIWPDYTSKSQKLKEYEEAQAKAEQERITAKSNAGEQLSDDEVAKQAIEQAKRLGLVTKDDIRANVMEVLEARDLLDNCKDLEREIDGKDGRPAFKTQDVLKYMDEVGIRDPQKAYRLMYEEQIDRWKEEQIKKAKPKGLVTEEGSPAGNRLPTDVKVTRDNLADLVAEAMGASS